ncbi:MAG: hypothetical protein HYY16_15160 [Planctomycetes bacterium]|nr:hypothetical protein [Planctomycetota bacterium]
MAQSRSEEWISRLLGIDRINLSDGEIGLDWHHKLDAWVILLVIVPVILGLVWFLYRRERKDVGPGPKVLLTALRAALALLIFLLLLGPILTVEINKIRKSYVLVLVDDSLSMKKVDVPSRADQKLGLAKAVRLLQEGAKEVTPEVEAALKTLTRADIIRRVLEDPERRILDEIEAKLNVAYFTFSKGARAVESREKLFEVYKPESIIGTETAIGDSIRQALAMYKGQSVLAVIVLSDGRNNFGAELGQHYIPIYTVLAGIPQETRDIALIELEAQQAVLVNDKLPVKFGVKSSGYNGQEIDVNLHVYEIKDAAKELSLDAKDVETYLQESSLDQTKKMTLDGSMRQSDDLVWQPREAGEYLLILRVPPREEERTDLNNVIVHRVRVADDKIKVLYVEHPPRYEYRFLKNALIRDTKILCHCLLTSADEGFPQEHTRDPGDPDFKEPLKEFPRTLKELLKYDVIIIGDVDPGRLGGREAWENIEKFVANFGGGVVFISGVMNNPRTFKDTPLERLLPVIVDDAGRDTEQTYERQFGYKLTDEAIVRSEARGGAHPIVSFPALGNDLNRIVEAWEDRDGRNDGLVGVRWFQKVVKVKPQGKVLVELTGVPQQETQAKRPPLFVAAHYGFGRVFWSATDETWLWRYLAGDQPWFYPFWQQAMYWTRYGKLLGAKRFRLRLDRHDRRYMTGDSVNLYVTAFDKNFELLGDPELEIYVEPPTGKRLSVRLIRDKERNGYYEGSFKPTEVGMYRAWAGEPDDDSTRATEKFVVYIPNREEDEPILDREELQRIAHASHPAESEGVEHKESECPNFFPIEKVGALPEALKESKHSLTELKEDDLWDSPAVYILFGLLITMEWILRKAWRML